jgi:hypothetical protein
MEPALSSPVLRELAVGAALAEAEARESRRPAAVEGVSGGEWARQARLDGLR